VTMLVEGVTFRLCPSANCDETRRLAKIRTNAPSILDDLKCEIGLTRAIVIPPPGYSYSFHVHTKLSTAFHHDKDVFLDVVVQS
jgi:hypothetical protein